MRKQSKVFWTLWAIIAGLVLTAPIWADVDTRDGTAITATSTIDGFTGWSDDIDGQVTTHGYVFASDWNDAANPQDGLWDSESDVDGNLAVTSNQLSLQHDTTTEAIVSESTFGADYTEATIIFTVKADTVADIDTTGSTGYIRCLQMRDTTGSTTAFYFTLHAAADDWTKIAVKYYTDAGSSWLGPSATTTVPAINTDYEVRIYYKTATGAEANDGIVKVKFNGNEDLALTTADNNGKVIGNVHGLGLLYSEWDTDDGLDLFFDNLRVYSGSSRY